MAFEFDKIEFIQLYLRLEFEDPYVLSLDNLLRLRRNLRQAAKQLELTASASDGLDFDRLFASQIPSDPFARRRYQLPGPPFVIHPPRDVTLPLEIIDSLELPVVLLGQGTLLLRELCQAFRALGARGFHLGDGRFELATVEAADLSGARVEVWRGSGMASPALPLIHAGWWLDSLVERSGARLQLDTPARLLSDGRPLFNPCFRALFPFILRRVSSMIYAHCGQELVDDPAIFMAAAERIVESDNRLLWRDWRSLEGDGRRQDIGGILGSVIIGGPGLREIRWLLRLASLLNLGKGAAYGAGHFNVVEIP